MRWEIFDTQLEVLERIAQLEAEGYTKKDIEVFHDVYREIPAVEETDVDVVDVQEETAESNIIDRFVQWVSGHETMDELFDDHDMPQEDRDRYREAVRNGKIIVAVDSHVEHDRIEPAVEEDMHDEQSRAVLHDEIHQEPHHVDEDPPNADPSTVHHADVRADEARYSEETLLPDEELHGVGIRPRNGEEIIYERDEIIVEDEAETFPEVHEARIEERDVIEMDRRDGTNKERYDEQNDVIHHPEDANKEYIDENINHDEEVIRHRDADYKGQDRNEEVMNPEGEDLIVDNPDYNKEEIRLDEAVNNHFHKPHVGEDAVLDPNQNQFPLDGIQEKKNHDV